MYSAGGAKRCRGSGGSSLNHAAVSPTQFLSPQAQPFLGLMQNKQLCKIFPQSSPPRPELREPRMYPQTQDPGCVLVQLLRLGSWVVSCPSFLSLLQVFPCFFWVGFVFSFSSFVLGNSSQDAAMNTANPFLSALTHPLHFLSPAT